MQNDISTISGVIRRFNSKEQATAAVSGAELIKNIFSNAVEYRGIALGTRGVATMFGITALGLPPWICYMMLSSGLEGIEFPFRVLFSLMYSIFGIYFFMKVVRLEMFRLEDEPIIFDRENRKVYRIYREVLPGWRGLFRAWPTKFAEHSWDLLDAEHHAGINANHANISRIHGLLFQVRNSQDDPTIVDGFAVGSSMLLSEISVPAVWEHIRRFMEENGPHVAPGETIVEHHNPTTFAESLKNAREIFSSLRKNNPIITIMLIIWLPISLPISIILTITSWLSYRTAIPISWPEHVIKAIGSPLNVSSSTSGPGAQSPK